MKLFVFTTPVSRARVQTLTGISNVDIRTSEYTGIVTLSGCSITKVTYKVR